MSAKKIIYGFHTITSLIRIDPMSIKEIFIDEYRTDGRVNDLMKLVETNKIKYHLFFSVVALVMITSVSFIFQ